MVRFIIIFCWWLSYPYQYQKNLDILYPNLRKSYNLEKDPYELNNIYDNPSNKELIKQLKNQFAQMRTENGADDPKFTANKVINEFWNYDQANRKKAEKISAAYAKHRNGKEAK